MAKGKATAAGTYCKSSSLNKSPPRLILLQLQDPPCFFHLRWKELSTWSRRVLQPQGPTARPINFRGRGTITSCRALVKDLRSKACRPYYFGAGTRAPLGINFRGQGTSPCLGGAQSLALPELLPPRRGGKGKGRGKATP